MNKSTFLTSLVLSIFGILLGTLFFFIDSEALLRIVFICIGIYVIIVSIPGFITFSSIHDKKERNITLITSIVIAAVGLVLIFYPHMVVNIIAGVLFIALPIYRIIISKNKKETFKKELFRLCLGVVLLLVGFSGVFQVMLYIIGGLLCLFSLLYLIYSLVLYIKFNKTQKKYEKENDVIDV